MEDFLEDELVEPEVTYLDILGEDGEVGTISVIMSTYIDGVRDAIEETKIGSFGTEYEAAGFIEEFCERDLYELCDYYELSDDIDEIEIKAIKNSDPDSMWDTTETLEVRTLRL